MSKILMLVTKDEQVIELFENINNDFNFDFKLEINSNEEISQSDLMKENTAALILDFDTVKPPIKDLVIEEVKENKLLIPTVILKADFENHEMRSFFKNKIHDCINKPIKNETIYRLLEEINIENKQAIQARHQISSDHVNSLRVSLIYNLLYGNIKNQSDIWKQSKIIGLSSVPNTAMAVHIDEFINLNRDKDKQYQDSIRNEIITLARQLLKKSLNEVLVMGTAADKFAILLSLPTQEDKINYKHLAIRLARGINTYIKKNTGYSVTVGIGNYYEDIRNLHVSYQEAVYAQKYKFFEGKDTVIHINDVEPFATEIKTLYNKDITILTSKLMVADIAAVKKTMTNLFDQMFTTQLVDPDVLKMQILEMSTTVARAAINGGADLNEIHKLLLKYKEDLEAIENIEKMKESLEHLIYRFTDLVFSNNNEYSLKSIQTALDYIEQHYMEEISLEDVSSHVYLSPAYFSRLFKNATGKNFVEYITHLRIEESKVLLKNLELTINQIALKVGFSNYHYFSRVFKSLVGKTPSDYRNTVLDSSINEVT